MTNKIKKNVLVSVVFFAENLPVQIVEHNLKSIINQLYENKKIIIFYDKNRSDFDDLILNYSPLNCNFIPEETGMATGLKINSSINGEVVFYKTCNSIDWLPRHIDVHLDLYSERKINWVHSLVEIHDVAKMNTPTNIVDWRLNKPKPDEIEFDEISHLTSVNVDWLKIFEKGFTKAEFLKQLGNGGVANEISIIKWINSYLQAKDQVAQQIGVPINQDLESNHFPTIVGNIIHSQRNHQILETIKAVDPNDIKSIAIKRTLGMGDVIMTESVRRYLKSIYPNAKITLLTSKSRGCDQISKYLGYDDVIFISESEITNDALMKVIEEEEIVEDEANGTLDVQIVQKYHYKNYQIKVDLDLSYESRLGKPYQQSYFELIGVDYDKLTPEQKQYQLYTELKTIDTLDSNKKIYMHRDGSGWAGKTWTPNWENNIPNPEYFDTMKKIFEDNGYEVTEHKHFEEIFDLFVELQKHKFYFGSDSGVMHIALALGLKVIVVGGAAVMEMTADPYIEGGQHTSIHVEERDLPCIGCKHKTFFELIQNGQITFVTPCSNQKGPQCMSELKPELITEIILKRLKE